MSGEPTSLVEEISNIHREGNIIPSAWFLTMQFPSKKSDLIAINLLAEVLYWYTKTEVRDEASGLVLGYRKKFKADLWQASYNGIAEKFGLTKRQATDAIERLEKRYHAVQRVFRTIHTKGGLTLNNVLFLEPLPRGIRILNALPNINIRDPYDVETSEGSRLDAIGPTFQRRTNTYTPTETTTEIPVPKTPSGDFSSSLPSFSAEDKGSERTQEPVTETDCPNPAIPGAKYSPGFLAFCAVHPWGTYDKAEAFGVWQKLKLEPYADAICARVTAQRNSQEYRGPKHPHQFMKRMPSYLRQKKWEDEVSKETTSNTVFDIINARLKGDPSGFTDAELESRRVRNGNGENLQSINVSFSRVDERRTARESERDIERVCPDDEGSGDLGISRECDELDTDE